VFPSLTDTFGLVMLEALACGVPRRGLPVQGPIDVLGDAPIAALDCDLGRACLRALEIPRLAARAFALTRSWRSCTEQFLSNLPVRFPIREVEAKSPAPDAALSAAAAPEPLRAVS